MCTAFYLADLGLLSKNRDKGTPEVEEIVQTADVLAVKTSGADYYSLGLNRHGCAFVSTAINNPEWTDVVESGRDEEAQRIMARDTLGLISPTVLVSRLLSTVRSVDEWIAAIKEAGTPWRGYNVVLADAAGAWLVETYRDAVAARPLPTRAVVTNHFREIDFGPRVPQDYPNSYARYDYAQEHVASIGGVADLAEVIRPQDLARRSRIWREGIFRTISSSILDFKNGRLLYTAQCDLPYREYGLG